MNSGELLTRINGSKEASGGEGGGHLGNILAITLGAMMLWCDCPELLVIRARTSDILPCLEKLSFITARAQSSDYSENSL